MSKYIQASFSAVTGFHAQKRRFACQFAGDATVLLRGLGGSVESDLPVGVVRYGDERTMRRDYVDAFGDEIVWTTRSGVHAVVLNNPTGLLIVHSSAWCCLTR